MDANRDGAGWARSEQEEVYGQSSPQKEREGGGMVAACKGGVRRKMNNKGEKIKCYNPRVP